MDIKVFRKEYMKLPEAEISIFDLAEMLIDFVYFSYS